LGALGLKARALQGEPPLLERRLAIGFKPFGGGERRSELCRLQGVDERLRYGVVDLNASDIEATDPSVLDQDLAGAVISRRRVATAIVGVQAASAMAAAGEALQERRPFSHGATALVRLRSRVLREALLICFIMGIPFTDLSLRDRLDLLVFL